ncbi:MAG: sigma-70 family RNA polymerase sigma factor [Flavobacteriales bacterium]|nr:sigma-70 family RNA polymerase sigma factor [Flavobacteriales bacterium]
MTQQKNIYHQSKSTIKKEESILKAATTNPAKFAPIYEKYYMAIFKFVLQRVENEQVASEIVSDVFAKAIFNLKKYKFKGYPFSAWLYRVAYNEIATKFRKKQKQRTVNIPYESWNLFSNDEDEENDIAIDLQKLKICLPKLKPNEIELIEMRFFEERPFKEIGEILELTTENARVKTHRVLKKLQKLFNTIK